MKAEELRIGNLVDTGNFHLPRYRGNYNVKEGWFIWANKFEPIPLTEEWLLKFGFKYDCETKKYHTPCFYWFSINLYAKQGAGFCIENVQYKFIDSVHQLQNLYFALTNQELTVK